MDMDTTHQERRCPDGDPDDRASCISGSRNRYFPRKTMTADDFTREQAYAIGRRRLLNRALYGWGVVYGLGVKLDGQHLTIDPGLALDRHGREVIVPAPHALRLCDLFVRVNDQCDPSHAPKPTAGRWLLSAHYAERPMDQVRLADPCDDCGKPEWNRVCETVVFSLSPLDAKSCPTAEPGCPDDCGCPQPAKPVETDGHYMPPEPAVLVIKPEAALNEQSREAPLKEPEKEELTDVQRIPPKVSDKLDPIPPYPRGPHSTMCCWSHNTQVEGDGSLCAWNHYCVDPGDPVPIVCVTLTGFDKCGDPIFGEIEECTPRRIVKRNDMLFDLIRGCDLTRITNVSWLPWTKASYVEWAKFRAAFRDNDQDLRGKDCPTALWIDFSAPVRAETVTPRAISITGVFQDSLTGWNRPLRLPITDIHCDPPDAGKKDPAGTTRRATIIVSGDWIWDEIQGPKSAFQVPDDADYFPFLEIDIYGDLILDCRGQPVDANSFGSNIVTTGNGTPGGTCRTVFRVSAKPLQHRSSARTGDQN
jgi:hypothetical protein